MPTENRLDFSFNLEQFAFIYGEDNEMNTVTVYL